jgi:hypothetical protein
MIPPNVHGRTPRPLTSVGRRLIMELPTCPPSQGFLRRARVDCLGLEPIDVTTALLACGRVLLDLRPDGRGRGFERLDGLRLVRRDVPFPRLPVRSEVPRCFVLLRFGRANSLAEAGQEVFRSFGFRRPRGYPLPHLRSLPRPSLAGIGTLGLVGTVGRDLDPRRPAHPGRPTAGPDAVITAPFGSTSVPARSAPPDSGVRLIADHGRNDRGPSGVGPTHRVVAPSSIVTPS